MCSDLIGGKQYRFNFSQQLVMSTGQQKGFKSSSRSAFREAEVKIIQNRCPFLPKRCQGGKCSLNRWARDFKEEFNSIFTHLLLSSDFPNVLDLTCYPPNREKNKNMDKAQILFLKIKLQTYTMLYVKFFSIKK